MSSGKARLKSLFGRGRGGTAGEGAVDELDRQTGPTGVGGPSEVDGDLGTLDAPAEDGARRTEHRGQRMMTEGGKAVDEHGRMAAPSDRSAETIEHDPTGPGWDDREHPAPAQAPEDEAGFPARVRPDGDPGEQAGSDRPVEPADASAGPRAVAASGGPPASGGSGRAGLSREDGAGDPDDGDGSETLADKGSKATGCRQRRAVRGAEDAPSAADERRVRKQRRREARESADGERATEPGAAGPDGDRSAAARTKRKAGTSGAVGSGAPGEARSSADAGGGAGSAGQGDALRAGAPSWVLAAVGSAGTPSTREGGTPVAAAAAADASNDKGSAARRARRVLRSSRDAAPSAAAAGAETGREPLPEGRSLAPYDRRGKGRELTKTEKGRPLQTGGRRNRSLVAAETALPTLTTRQKRELALPTRAAQAERPRLFGRLMMLSFVVLVLLPAVTVVLFYAFVATPQYASEAQFSVRGAMTMPTSEVPSLLTAAGPPSIPELADSLILVDYVHSREVVDSLIENADFLQIYSRPEADFYYRLDPSLPIEDIVDYWRMMSDIKFDETSMIMTLKVRAFRPEDAKRVADHVLKLSEDLVNELSARARNDSVQLAREEVALAEARFRNARTALADFRDEEREIDPTATATSRQTILATLQSQLSEQEALLSSLLSTMSEEAPRVVYVRNQIEALRRQIAAERENVASPEQVGVAAEPVLTRRLSRFEELEAERLFAQQAYTSALTALETSRMEATKQQRYVAVFVRPAVPEEATYPQAIRWSLIVGGGIFLGWGILALVAAAFRDRMA